MKRIVKPSLFLLLISLILIEPENRRQVVRSYASSLLQTTALTLEQAADWIAPPDIDAGEDALP